MESVNLNFIISNADEDDCARIGWINSSEVHRVTLTNASWMPKNRFILINDTMRQRLNLKTIKTLPPEYFIPGIDQITSSRGPYPSCESVHLSFDPINYKLKSLGHPVLVPDLPVDFVLGTLYFTELNLVWSSRLQRLVSRRDEEERVEEEMRRQMIEIFDRENLKEESL